MITNGIFVFDPKDETNKHVNQSSWKTTAMIVFEDCEIDKYYAWFIKRRFGLTLNRPLRDPHVSFINDRKSDMNYTEYERIRSVYHNTRVEVEYDPNLIRTNGDHWWLRCSCLLAEEIRNDIGLNKRPFFDFHITIGYANEKNIEHSKYILRQILKYDL